MPIQFRTKGAIASFAQHSIFEIYFHCWILSVVFCWVVSHYMNKPQFISFSIDQHWSCFHFLATMNKNAMNILVQSFFCRRIYLSLLDKYIGVELLVVNFVRNCYTIFQSGCMILQLIYMRVSVAPHPPNIL